MKHAFSLIALVTAFPAFAEDTRQLDAHEHGVGTLDIAIEGTNVAMAFTAPGADIVGFEYAAESDTDLAKVETAIAKLSAPMDLFVIPDAAGCSVVNAQAELEGEDEHEEHDKHSHDDHSRDDHDKKEHDDHHDGDHVDHGKEGHDGHTDEAGHTEFHAEYALSCSSPVALTEVTFAYFDAFPNAQEVEVQIITASGAQALEVERDTPVLSLGR